ncbi:protein DMP6-like [Gossypium hirsutum]|uniref:Protein DMP6-like n=1 Tax=Gossypium hirsutum TaxID=3635 RepID=A0A1U8IY61_GOSHI|nr:protein DMP6-like [Gossypium hirsutum]
MAIMEVEEEEVETEDDNAGKAWADSVKKKRKKKMNKLSCLLSSFTDSFRDKDGNVCYGFATLNGLWVIDGSVSVPPEFAAKYRLRSIDFMHAFMSMLVFAAVALFDQNVVTCFYPTPSARVQEILTALPAGIGVCCSMLFVVFPTTRHGIGFPLSAN